ncbi:ADP-ribosylglycohydrolase family protein [Anaerocolumna sp. MB42-C2]|uniref:ADP-ribosylglycohydrolase family protein n=1 Tax=Anaerocolumna sp. MB42-C2 TaxID=3070997 RepID=UPI0027E10E6A|nr:ADP-ribosylglycohydrolase family protein [Anaerocolumna sp. MB42-C2]WMJ89204.1 ADP-ribosylglycohydrolase family protein [Anaerocolumna sp. MB42-C2]
MKQLLIKQILEALAVGDSFSKSTEFASREQIKSSFYSIESLLLPSESLAHKDMRYGQVTDDTEQNIFLLEDYCKSSSITPEVAANSLIRWYKESAEPEKYIGPSSRKAILAIIDGMDISLSGTQGTSCGGIMRVPSAFLCSPDLNSLQNNIISTLLPTHNTNIAMEAAIGYGYALFAMTKQYSIDNIIQAALKGCEIGRKKKNEEMDLACAPSCQARIPVLLHYLPQFNSDDMLLDFLFYVFGTTISSCDVFMAAFSLFLWCRKDVYKAIRMSSMLGGDTDTIGCLAAVLCCCYGKGHNIPEQIVHTVVSSNNLNLDDLSLQIYQYRKNQNKTKKKDSI